MYKGSTSYDSFDESDTEAIEELKGDSDEELLRISKEYQDPEDDPYRERQIKKGKTVIVAYKPSKSKMNEIYDEVKNALKSQKIEKITDLLSEITDKKESRRESQSNDYEEDEYTGEAQHEKRSNLVEKEWKVFAKKVIDSTPDPVVSIKNTIYSHSKESIKKRYKIISHISRSQDLTPSHKSPSSHSIDHQIQAGLLTRGPLNLRTC